LKTEWTLKERYADGAGKVLSTKYQRSFYFLANSGVLGRAGGVGFSNDE
jgi:hypothetical protein